jgi:hypothetical protein
VGTDVSKETSASHTDPCGRSHFTATRTSDLMDDTPVHSPIGMDTRRQNTLWFAFDESCIRMF